MVAAEARAWRWPFREAFGGVSIFGYDAEVLGGFMRVAPKPRLRAPADLRAYAEKAATWLLGGMAGGGLGLIWGMGYPLPAAGLALVALGAMFFVHRAQGELAWRVIPLFVCTGPFSAAGSTVMLELPRDVWTLGICCTSAAYVSLLWLHRAEQRTDRLAERHVASVGVKP